MNKQIHIDPSQQTTYKANHADTTYFLDKGDVLDPMGDGVDAFSGVTGRDFHIAGALKGGDALNIGDLFTHKGAGDLTVTHSGSIFGKFQGVTSQGNGQTIENAGQISSDGLALEAEGTRTHLTNTGMMTGKTGVNFDGDRAFLDNSGKIFGTSDAVMAWGDHSILTNNGLISGGHDAVSLSGDHSRLSNAGSIVGVNAGVIVADFTSAEPHFIGNTGHITGLFSIYGSDGQDFVRNSGTLSGAVDLRGGNDVFDGRGGVAADEIRGGDGNDLFIVSHKVTITEYVNEGYDIVKSSVSFTLPQNCEELHLTGKGNIDATGTTSYEMIVGNRGDNVIDGLGGGDELTGGAGADTFVYKSGYQAAYVVDAEIQGPSHDLIDLSATTLHSFADVLAHATNGPYGVTIDFGSGDTLVLHDLHKADIHAGDFIFA